MNDILKATLVPGRLVSFLESCIPSIFLFELYERFIQ